jgi:uncharacterized repeat protein (TIGR01451 family)
LGRTPLFSIRKICYQSHLISEIDGDVGPEISCFSSDELRLWLLNRPVNDRIKSRQEGRILRLFPINWERVPMLNTILKLTAMTGVVGIGFLFVIQAQRGVNQPVAQQQSLLTGPESAELETPIPGKVEFDFSEEVVQIEQSEPVFDEETIENNPERSQIFNSTDHHTHSGGGLDFSVSENRILQTEIDGSEAMGAPAVLPVNETSETPRPLFDISPSDSSAAASQPEFNSLSADSREPLFSSSAETPGDSVFSPDEKDAEIPGDSVLSPSEILVGEIPGDAIPSESMPKLSESGQSPFETSDAVTSSQGDSPKDAYPIIESQEQSSPFGSAQSIANHADNTPEPNPGSNHLKQAYPLVDTQPSPVMSDTSNSTNNFFPADEINTNGTKNSDGTESSSPALTASPFPSAEIPAFNPELNPVPTTHSETSQSDQPEAFPKAASPPALLDNADHTLDGQTVSSAESQEQDDSESPLFFELDDTPSLVQDDSLNPFDVTSNAARLSPNSPQPSDQAGSLSNPNVAQQPQLNIEKVAPPNAVLGEPMIYSIIVQNMGAVPVHQVMVVDRIPKGTELMGTIPQAELDENRLIWKIGTFQPKEKRTILVRITPREVGQIGSVATVQFFSEVADTDVKKPELKLSMSVQSQARLGEPVVYRFKVTNTGTEDAKQVFIRNILPDGLSHPGGEDLEYSIGTLQAGESEEIVLTLTAESPGTSTNRVLVTAESGVKIEKTVSLKIVASPLIISRTGPKQANVDQQTTFINLITNDSNHPLERITVTEKIPLGMKFIEATYGGRYDPTTKSVAWSIDRLGPKQSMELKVKLVPTVEGTQTSVVQAVDADGTKIEVTSQTKVYGTAALNVDIVSLEQPISVGEQHTLRVFVRNRGSASSTNIQARFFVPDELQIVSAQGPAQYVQKGNQIIFSPVPEVKKGMQAIYDLTLKARQSGKARVRVDINADQFNQPLIRDESISILPAN